MGVIGVAEAAVAYTVNSAGEVAVDVVFEVAVARFPQAVVARECRVVGLRGDGGLFGFVPVLVAEVSIGCGGAAVNGVDVGDLGEVAAVAAVGIGGGAVGASFTGNAVVFVIDGIAGVVAIFTVACYAA